VQERTEAALSLSVERDFPFYLAWGAVIQGWAIAEQEQVEEGIGQMHQGLTGMRATGAELWRSYHLVLLAEIYIEAWRLEEVFSVLTEALGIVQATKIRLVEAELYRLKGELTLQQANQKAKVKRQKSKKTDPRSLTPDPQDEAEACFLKAIEVSRKQQAKSLELRATMSLARLWQQQDKRDEARQILAEVYGWFTEGFDTKDLQEAKALLDSLESRVPSPESKQGKKQKAKGTSRKLPTSDS
jgi:predicted ATPase